ncbi:MAG: hypothetical protein A4E49_01776 [Methanosaeta sp. PtaU1.Bin112]|nr:MAG: hypothetical protein A4E49_01776 [Methanosaeta sp. PtaU1.Bin112]
MAGKVIDEPPVIVTEPNLFWKENARKLVGESISTIECVAKQIIVVTGLLEGLYFHAITFSNLRGSLNGCMLLVFLAPIVLWLASLFFAMWTLSPKAHDININSSRDSKKIFEVIVSEKHLKLKVAEALLLASFLPLLIAVYYYLTTKPPA